MQRPPRLPRLAPHVIVRGINRQDIFLGDEDRRRFCERFSGLLQDTQTPCLAWALIPNHVHLLLRPNQISHAPFTRRRLKGYAGIFNLRHQRSGRLFENHCNSVVCEEEPYLLVWYAVSTSIHCARGSVLRWRPWTGFRGQGTAW